MTRADFARVGGFDEGFFLHVEDIDLCWRVRHEGGVVLFQPAAEVVHIGSTSAKAPLFVEISKGFGLVRYFRKRAATAPARLTVLALAPLILAVSAARALLRRRRRPR
jgi:GT2 family glycosyltransferase